MGSDQIKSALFNEGTLVSHLSYNKKKLQWVKRMMYVYTYTNNYNNLKLSNYTNYDNEKWSNYKHAINE